MKVVSGLCGRVVVLHHGRLIADGSAGHPCSRIRPWSKPISARRYAERLAAAVG